MEVYSDFQIKDHYFWTDASPEYVTKPEPQAEKPTPEPAQYVSWEEREADGSITYYDAQIRKAPVRIDGYMI